MKRKVKWLLVGATFAFAIVGSAVRGTVAQQAAPTENVGVSVRLIGTVDLGPEIEGMAGRQLRMRVVTIAPGGVLAVHNHQDRPAVEFVQSGTVTEYRSGVERTVREGDPVLSDKNTTHWWRNTGTVPVVFVVSDIFRPE